MAQKGKDPKHERERARQANLRQAGAVFERVAEDFIRARVAGKRKGKEVTADIRREFVSRWGKRPIADITRFDVRAVVEAARDRGASYQAINLLSYAKLLFNWAAEIGEYGFEQSPCDQLKARTLGLTKVARKRILSDAELRAYWSAAEGMRYPFGSFLKVLA